jgi:hypothetical protein
LPRALPSPVAPEIAPETEQNPVPLQEVRHEVNTCTESCYLFISQHSRLGNVILSGSGSVIIKPINGG